MAQVLKDEIRDNIINSAREEFLEYGYEDSSMRRIAIHSRMTVGNLYRYFKNKEELNKVIVSGTYDEINELLGTISGDVITMGRDVENVHIGYDELKTMMNQLVDGLMDIYQNHKVELNILMMESRLNKEITEWFTLLLCRLIADNYAVEENSASIEPLARAYAIAIFHGLKTLFKETDTDTETLRNMVTIYLNSYVGILKQNINELEGLQ